MPLFHGHLYLAAWLVILAMVFDFFDGFAARLLHVKSEMGKELIPWPTWLVSG